MFWLYAMRIETFVQSSFITTLQNARTRVCICTRIMMSAKTYCVPYLGKLKNHSYPEGWCMGAVA